MEIQRRGRRTERQAASQAGRDRRGRGKEFIENNINSKARDHARVRGDLACKNARMDVWPVLAQAAEEGLLRVSESDRFPGDWDSSSRQGWPSSIRGGAQGRKGRREHASTGGRNLCRTHEVPGASDWKGRIVLKEIPPAGHPRTDGGAAVPRQGFSRRLGVRGRLRPSRRQWAAGSYHKAAERLICGACHGAPLPIPSRGRALIP